jgi:transposase
MQNNNQSTTEAAKASKLKRFFRLITDGSMSKDAAAKRVGSSTQSMRRWAIELGLKWPSKKK